MPIEIRHHLWYQSDGFPIYNKEPVQEPLLEIFRCQVIGHNMGEYWLARSPDLNSLNFFLGLPKIKNLQTNPIRNVDHLEKGIRNSILDITPRSISNSIKDVSRGTIVCIERNGRYREI